MRPPYKTIGDVVDVKKHKPRWPKIHVHAVNVWPGWAEMYVFQDMEARSERERYWGCLVTFGEDEGPPLNMSTRWRRMKKTVSFKEIVD